MTELLRDIALYTTVITCAVIVRDLALRLAQTRAESVAINALDTTVNALRSEVESFSKKAALYESEIERAKERITRQEMRGVRA